MTTRIGAPLSSPRDGEPVLPEAGTIVLFDGVCNLCNASVQFLLRRDRERRFRFAALQSAAGRTLLERYGLPTDSLSTIVVLEGGRARVQSAAALLLARRLPWPWPLLAVFTILPRPLRDALYAFVARHRYRWFGRTESCMLPTREVADRFLE
jgi:predicted DCC family thiol-disulfide oxidoreductase YuxK